MLALESNPFAAPAPAAPVWALAAAKEAKYDAMFDEYGASDGLLQAEPARGALMATGLPTDQLFKIWELSDIDEVRGTPREQG